MNYQDLLALMEAIQEKPIPAPSGSYDSLVEFDRRNAIKQQLLSVVIGTCLESALAVGGMRGAVDATENAGEQTKTARKSPLWEPALLRLEQAMCEEMLPSCREVLPKFLEQFQHEPLLITPLHQGGQARLILRASMRKRSCERWLLTCPGWGCYERLLSSQCVARTMESEQKLEGPRQTDFRSPLSHRSWPALRQ